MNKARYDKMVLLQNYGIKTNFKPLIKSSPMKANLPPPSLDTSKEFTNSLSNRTIQKQSGSVTFMTQPKTFYDDPAIKSDHTLEPQIVEDANESRDQEDQKSEKKKEDDTTQWDVSHWLPKSKDREGNER